MKILDSHEMAQLLGLRICIDPFPIVKGEVGEYILVGDRTYRKAIRRVKEVVLSPDEWGTRTSSTYDWYWEELVEGGVPEYHYSYKEYQEQLKEAAEFLRIKNQ